MSHRDQTRGGQTRFFFSSKRNRNAETKKKKIRLGVERAEGIRAKCMVCHSHIRVRPERAGGSRGGAT